MTDVELEREAATNTILDQDARFLLDDRRFSERGDKLRAAVADGFKKRIRSQRSYFRTEGRCRHAATT